MTHELTHATVRASTTRAVPAWLAEGFAELVAYRRCDLPERDVVAPALDRVRDDGLPSTLPADADFDPADRDAAPRRHTASPCSRLRTIAEHHGTPGSCGSTGRPPAVAVPASALGDARGDDRPGAAAQARHRPRHARQAWRDRITRVLGP